MKNLLILFGLLLLMALPGLGQKHEVGAAGGGMVGYAEGKFNNTTMKAAGMPEHITAMCPING